MEIEQRLNDLQKQLQKEQVNALGMSGTVKSQIAQRNLEVKAKAEIEAGQSVISSRSEALEKAIKGQFSKKITAVFEEQEKLLEDLV